MKSLMVTITVTASVLAVLVPVASAATPGPLSDIQLSRTSRVQQPDLVERYARAHAPMPAPDLVERWAARHVTAVPETTPGSGFDWTAASMGAGAILAGLALAAAGTLTVRSTRHRIARGVSST